MGNSYKAPIRHTLSVTPVRRNNKRTSSSPTQEAQNPQTGATAAPLMRVLRPEPPMRINVLSGLVTGGNSYASYVLEEMAYGCWDAQKAAGAPVPIPSAATAVMLPGWGI